MQSILQNPSYLKTMRVPVPAQKKHRPSMSPFRCILAVLVLFFGQMFLASGAHAAFCEAGDTIGSLGSGIAAMDNASGTGWLLWSEEPVGQRFSPKPHRDNAEHFIAVSYTNGQWYFDNNRVLTPFSPLPTDCLVAEIDFSNDSISVLHGSDDVVFGVDSGVSNNLISAIADRWNGELNRGEFEISSGNSSAASCSASIMLGQLGSGIAALDNAAGTGWMLWSEEPVHQRFSPSPHRDNAEHFIAVSYTDGQWYFDNNRVLTPFSPEPTDCLVAEIDFSNDSIAVLPITGTVIFGINSGVPSNFISVAANRWNDEFNAGEFGLTEFRESGGTIPGINNYELVFSDEFSGSSLDPSKWDTGLLWGPYHPINNEEQLYVDTLGMHSGIDHSPFEFTGSTLKITATPVSNSLRVPPRPDFYLSDGSRNPIWRPNDYSEYRFNGPVTDSDGNTDLGFQPEDVNYLSGIITSYDSFKMTHGYVETRAKIPAGRGLWPAFWLLTTHYVEDVPEIDVMEFLGQDVDRLYNTYHYFDVEDNYRKISTPSFPVYAENDPKDWTQDFHTFGMAWSPEEIIWYVDGKETHRITDSEYVIANQAMYLIANLAVGGNWPGAPDASTQFPATFELDYIRAYKRKLDPVLNLTEDYTLQFRDEFNGTTLDPSKWNTHYLWGPYLTINREEQYYVDALGSDAADTTSSNTPFVIDNGMLSITARPKNDPNSFQIPEKLPRVHDPLWRDFRSFYRNPGYAPENLNFTSGVITSYEAFKFSYGYAEAKMRLPKGSGLWPAFWLLNGYYVGEQPEIDIMEARGGSPDLISHNFHTYNGDLNPSDSVSQHPDPDLGFAGNFHRYGVRWQPGRLDFYIDREIVHTYEDEDFNAADFPGKNYDEAPVPYQNMYVIANLAAGGNFFIHPDDPYVSPVDPNAVPASLDIDYIRVWQEKHKD